MHKTKVTEYSLQDVPHYKVHGRTIPGVCPLPLFFNGSAIEVNVSGSELWIDIDAGYHVHEIWITCEINGELMSRQMLMPGRYQLCLFRGMSQQPADPRLCGHENAAVEKRPVRQW